MKQLSLLDNNFYSGQDGHFDGSYDSHHEDYNDLKKTLEEKTADLAAALVMRDEFLMAASHELKTPLTSLKLRLQLGKRNLQPEKNKFPSREDLEKFYDHSLEQVNSLVNLIEDMLDVSRIQSGRFNLEKKQLNLTALVSRVAERFKELMTKADLQLTLGPDIHIHADHYRMEQMISNLLSNALKFAPGSKIEVDLKISDDKKNVILTVKDYGPGIVKEKQELIFDRYERLASYTHVGGLGLGLYIVKQIVQGHDGDVKLLSEPNHGSCFVVRLPFK